MSGDDRRAAPGPRESLEGIIVRIRSRIISGEYPVGFHLRESQLASDLGVSRTPIREALHRLAVEGVVDVYANRGARVAGWSDDELDQIFGLRVLLESYGARLAAGRISESNLERLGELARQMEDAIQSGRRPPHDRIAALNNEFHREILQAAGNDRLVAILSSLVHLPLVYRTFLRYSKEQLQQSMSHHRELIQALTAHDAEWAEAVMRSHLIAARTLLVDRSAESARDSSAAGSQG